MSLMTKSQVTKGRDRLRTNAVKARQQARQARQQARRAASQVGPFAASARVSARRGMYGARRGVRSARAWTAPRLDRSGHVLQNQVAPVVAAMLRRAARRIEPAKTRRRRWPFLAAGLVSATCAAAAAVFMNRRGAMPFGRKTSQSEPDTAADAEQPDTTADANGRVRSS